MPEMTISPLAQAVLGLRRLRHRCVLTLDDQGEIKCGTRGEPDPADVAWLQRHGEAVESLLRVEQLRGMLSVYRAVLALKDDGVGFRLDSPHGATPIPQAIMHAIGARKAMILDVLRAEREADAVETPTPAPDEPKPEYTERLASPQDQIALGELSLGAFAQADLVLQCSSSMTPTSPDGQHLPLYLTSTDQQRDALVGEGHMAFSAGELAILLRQETISQESLGLLLEAKRTLGASVLEWLPPGQESKIAGNGPSSHAGPRPRVSIPPNQPRARQGHP